LTNVVSVAAERRGNLTWLFVGDTKELAH
jgi:hypothetical protein